MRKKKLASDMMYIFVIKHTLMLFQNHLRHHRHPSYPPKDDRLFHLVLHSCSNQLLHLQNLGVLMMSCYLPSLVE